ncbi:MAG: hypothetical protein ACQEQP_01030 [Bacillota bacterium]
MDKFKIRCLECGREITIKYEYKQDNPNCRQLSAEDQINFTGNENKEVHIVCKCGNEVCIFNQSDFA